MKKVIIALVFAFCFQAIADSSGLSSLFVAGLIGGAVNTGYQGSLGRLPDELSDWSDPSTQTTSRLDQQCGLLTEMKLVRTGSLNFLFVGVRNEGQSDISLNLERSRAIFSSGRERFFLTQGANRVLEVRKNWYVWGFLPFPAKADFKDQKSINVEIPLIEADGSECTLKTQFERPEDSPQDPSSYISAPSNVVSIGIGVVGSAFGRLSSSYTKAQGAAGMEVYLGGFKEPTRGYYLQLGMYSSKLKDPAAFGNPEYTELSAYDLSVGWARRQFLKPKVTGYFNFGPSIGDFTARNPDISDLKNGESKGGLGVYSSYTLEYEYAHEYFGYFKGRYATGLTLFVKYYPQVYSDAPKDVGTVGVIFELLRGGE